MLEIMVQKYEIIWKLPNFSSTEITFTRKNFKSFGVVSSFAVAFFKKQSEYISLHSFREKYRK